MVIYLLVIGFGSFFEQLFPESRVYTEETFVQLFSFLSLFRFNLAKQYVLDMRADLQGTDVLPPIIKILSSIPRQDYPRQIFFLVWLLQL